MFTELLILFLSIVTFLHYYLKYQLPPGPFSIPLIGTIGILGRISGGGICNVKWHKYQKMYTVFIGRMVIVVINDFKLTKELFAKEEFSGKILYPRLLQNKNPLTNSHFRSHHILQMDTH